MSARDVLVSAYSYFSYSVGLESETARKRSQLGNSFLTATVCVFIAGVAYADSRVEEISLGYLYILPIALSGLVNRLHTSIFFVIVCVALHDVYGPAYSVPGRILLNFLALIGFSAVALMTNRMGKEREAMSAIIHRQHDELAREINLASRVQQRLLPQAPPQIEGVEIACGITYLKEMGGDYYDFIELNESGLGIAIADVSGKGTSAAIVMPTIEVALRMEALNGQDSTKGFRNLNKVICEVTENSRFVTLFYGQLKILERSLEYINAGHNPPFLYRQQSGASEWLGALGPPIGLLEEAEYLPRTISLGKDDILVCYTDGLSETENAEGEQFSKDRIAQITIENAGDTAQKIYESLLIGVDTFRGTKSLDDDLTLIVLKVTA
jgi:serine phosphatase RsbU (regulator of sigma subunit)